MECGSFQGIQWFRHFRLQQSPLWKDRQATYHHFGCYFSIHFPSSWELLQLLPSNLGSRSNQATGPGHSIGQSGSTVAKLEMENEQTTSELGRVAATSDGFRSKKCWTNQGSFGSLMMMMMMMMMTYYNCFFLWWWFSLVIIDDHIWFRSVTAIIYIIVIIIIIIIIIITIIIIFYIYKNTLYNIV